MTDTEISRRLALAIGYGPVQVKVIDGLVHVDRFGFWEHFDHRDERTIFRIAARYNMFPCCANDGKWTAFHGTYVYNDCPATCIALAVIEASERGLLS